MKKVSPSLLSKIKSQKQTHYNNADPKLNITIARARSSIMDSSYFTIEKIRTKEGIGDISIAARRLKPYGSPDRLYEIHIDNGMAKTAIREYPDKLREGWKNDFEIGPAISVAIAFDGRWKLNDKKQWQLVTYEEPYIFWVDSINKLYCRIWDIEDTTEDLATNVTKVKAIRAWKNASIRTHDQGVVAAYIKTDGKVYYRNYCEQEDGNYVWETERQVSEFTSLAVNLNLFITNDYRTGLVVEDNNGKIHWLITSRNWASMAIAPERIIAKANINIDFIETTKYRGYCIERVTSKPNIALDFLYASSFNEFKHIENIDDGTGNFGIKVKIKTKYGLYNCLSSEFKLTDSDGVSFNCEDIENISPNELVLTFMDFNNAVGEVKLSYVRTSGTNEAGYAFDDFEGTFMPTGLIPAAIPVPEVEVIWNE